MINYIINLFKRNHKPDEGEVEETRDVIEGAVTEQEDIGAVDEATDTSELSQKGLYKPIGQKDKYEDVDVPNIQEMVIYLLDNQYSLYYKELALDSKGLRVNPVNSSPYTKYRFTIEYDNYIALQYSSATTKRGKDKYRIYWNKVMSKCARDGIYFSLKNTYVRVKQEQEAKIKLEKQKEYEVLNGFCVEGK